MSSVIRWDDFDEKTQRFPLYAGPRLPLVIGRVEEGTYDRSQALMDSADGVFDFSDFPEDERAYLLSDAVTSEAYELAVAMLDHGFPLLFKQRFETASSIGFAISRGDVPPNLVDRLKTHVHEGLSSSVAAMSSQTRQRALDDLLDSASQSGTIWLMEAAIALGADPNGVNDDSARKGPPLIDAIGVADNFSEVANTLVAAGARLDVTQDGQPPMVFAFSRDAVEAVQWLQEQGMALPETVFNTPLRKYVFVTERDRCLDYLRSIDARKAGASISVRRGAPRRAL